MKLTPLCDVRKGQLVRVMKFEGGRGFTEEIKHMGLIKGAIVEVVSGGHGPTLVMVGNTRLAIGHGMSEKIMVIPV